MKDLEQNKRRDFLKKLGLTGLATIIGTNIVFGKNMPKDYVPLVLEDYLKDKHPDMVVLNNKPWNVEAQPHLLDDEFTPADKFFIRNNGIPPEQIDVNSWTLQIEGESVVNRKTYTIAELKAKFKTHSYYLTLECGGNGRAGYYPPASGNQWTEGAVACSKWTGVRLKDVLQDAGVKPDAVYIGYFGKDTHLSGEEGKVSISRGVPIAKALEDESLIAWAMNDENIPLVNGHPLRLVIGGWPASTSGKWLSKIVVRNIIHDGPKMEGTSYRMPKNPVQPGEKVAEEDFEIIESMPVKSLVTFPKTGAMIKEGEKLTLRGQAWAGDLAVDEMHVSIDFGATWHKCELKSPPNRLSWQRWNTEIGFPKKGYYEVWAKATDSQGKSQPMVTPGWNPKGYLNNSCHRIAIKVV